jgi:hypothetical protein
MTPLTEDYKNIPGWGMDADPENEPTYPIKHYTGDDHNRINYERSPQQLQNVEILMSTERPKMTAVFGNTVPPSGFSGAIRRYAFKHSEDRYRHWLPLIMADRINMFEGLIADIKQGQFPNMIRERGWKMEWRYNRTNFVKKILVTSLAAAAIVSLVLDKRK